MQLQERVVARVGHVQEAVGHPVEHHAHATHTWGERAGQCQPVHAMLDVGLGQRPIRRGKREDGAIGAIG